MFSDLTGETCFVRRNVIVEGDLGARGGRDGVAAGDDAGEETLAWC